MRVRLMEILQRTSGEFHKFQSWWHWSLKVSGLENVSKEIWWFLIHKPISLEHVRVGVSEGGKWIKTRYLYIIQEEKLTKKLYVNTRERDFSEGKSTDCLERKMMGNFGNPLEETSKSRQFFFSQVHGWDILVAHPMETGAFSEKACRCRGFKRHSLPMALLIKEL